MIRILLFLALSAIIEKSIGDDIPRHVQYLIKYGYLETSLEGGPIHPFTDDNITSALKTAQKFAGIPETGKLDNETIKMVTASRCDVPDTGSKLDKYGTDGKWNKRHLTYGILKYSPQVQPDQTREAISRAFSNWARHTRLRFSPSQDPQRADIIISFVKGRHGNCFPFFGRGGGVAHASSPHGLQQCYLHFNDDEHYTAYQHDDLQQLYSVLHVGTHEIGHTLGLQHTNVPGSIMGLDQLSSSPTGDLGIDDIMGIQSLYGKP